MASSSSATFSIEPNRIIPLEASTSVRIPRIRATAATPSRAWASTPGPPSRSDLETAPKLTVARTAAEIRKVTPLAITTVSALAIVSTSAASAGPTVRPASVIAP